MGLSSFPSAASSRPDSSSGPRGRVLIVDDEIFIRNACQLYLETVGFSVQVAESGEQALEIFENSRDTDTPDVVILDLVMPGLGGIEVLKTIKAKNSLVEVIIATGCGSMGSAIEALRFGAFDYITKPIVNFEKDLLKVIEEAMRIREDNLQQSRKSGGTTLRRGELEELQRILDQIVEIAGLVNGYRGGDPILRRIEELLRKHFAAEAGIVLCGESPAEFHPVHSWNFPETVKSRDPWPEHSELFRVIQNAGLAFFPAAALNTTGVGVPAEIVARWRVMATLPLCVQGFHWGTLLLFFAEELPTRLHGSVEKHPFQVLASLLASVYSEALRRN